MTHTQILGSVRAENGVGAVRVEDVYDATPEELWSAITEPERLANWVADVTGDLTVGSTVQATFTSSWEGPVRIDVCQPHQRLLVTMNPGEPDETVVEAVLTPEGDRTRLVVEERGLPLDQAAAYGAGWQAHVEDLTAHLAGRSRGDWRGRWNELAGPYAELMAANPTR
jgi:uncharacterized protein YndB with AHSA1/START domain